MRKLPLLLSTLGSLLWANETIEIMAQEVSATTQNIYAYSDVLILYDGAMLQSNSASYDKNSSLLTLEGEVEVLGLQNNHVVTDRLVINTQQKSVTFKKLFITGEENLWIDSQGATKEQENYKLFNSRVSSCNMANPDWTIEFKEAYYRHDKEFMTMEDARLRFYDRTIFYFPYLAFPTVHKRTTGLLLPRFSLSDTEGFLYEQPFFYAPTHNWDMEFNPQIRLNRGVGGHVTGRFVDSNHSEGYVRTGYFQNFAHYYEKYDLNREHFGMELFYTSTDILPQVLNDQDLRSGLYIDGIHLTDREYLNLQKERASDLVRSNLIESRLNAFVYDERNYLGFYGRYNIDTSQSSNDATLQEIPSLHYHRYFSPLLSSPFFYAIDGRLRNHTRSRGSRAYQGELDVPITYFDAFFNDYLDLSASENLYLTKVNFRHLGEEGGDYYYYRNYHTVQLSSDLNKAYGSSV
ncbi:MAG TPA: LPS-assembly protein LptD, partial [Campylobacterales bacterium]|nr:LPS-assembly protein LptD [Campylobacterales bacterium]